MYIKKMFCCLSVFLLLAITESFAIPREGTMTDFRDECTYKIVNTGSKTIMTENLRYNSSTSFNWTEALDISSKYQKKENTYVENVEVKGICPEGWHIPSVEEFFDALAPLSIKKKVHFFDEGEEWDEEIFVFNSKYSSLMGFKSGEEYWTKDQIHCCDGPDEFAHTFVVKGKEITNRSNLYGSIKTAKLQIRCMKDR